MKTAWWSANPFNPDSDALVLSRARFSLRSLECPADPGVDMGARACPVLFRLTFATRTARLASKCIDLGAAWVITT
jgi:hypothetical protein